MMKANVSFSSKVVSRAKTYANILNEIVGRRGKQKGPSI